MRMTMRVIRMMIEYSYQEYGGHLNNVKSMARAEFLQLWYDEACLNQRQLRLPGAHPVALQRVLWHLFWKNKPGSLEFVFHCIRSTLIKTDLCKKKLNIKMKKQQARWAQQKPVLSLARSFCVSLQSRWLYYRWANVYEKRFLLFQYFCQNRNTWIILGVLGMCTHVCGNDVMFV